MTALLAQVPPLRVDDIDFSKEDHRTATDTGLTLAAAARTVSETIGDGQGAGTNLLVPEELKIRVLVLTKSTAHVLGDVREIARRRFAVDAVPRKPKELHRTAAP